MKDSDKKEFRSMVRDVIEVFEVDEDITNADIVELLREIAKELEEATL